MVQLEKLERKCPHCKTHQSARNFNKHEACCKKFWRIRQDLHVQTTWFTQAASTFTPAGVGTEAMLEAREDMGGRTGSRRRSSLRQSVGWRAH
jgi:hypothetical protein